MRINETTHFISKTKKYLKVFHYFLHKKLHLIVIFGRSPKNVMTILTT